MRLSPKPRSHEVLRWFACISFIILTISSLSMAATNFFEILPKEDQSITLQMFKSFSTYTFPIIIQPNTKTGTTFNLHLSLDSLSVGINISNTNKLTTRPPAKDLTLPQLFSSITLPTIISIGKQPIDYTTISANTNEEGGFKSFLSANKIASVDGTPFIQLQLFHIPSKLLNRSVSDIIKDYISNGSFPSISSETNNGNDQEEYINTSVLKFKLPISLHPLAYPPFPLYCNYYQTDIGPSKPIYEWSLDINTGFTLGKDSNNNNNNNSSTEIPQVSWLGPFQTPGKNIFPLKLGMIPAAKIYIEEKTTEWDKILDLNDKKFSKEHDKMSITSSLYTSITFINSLLDMDNSIYYTIQVGEDILPVNLTQDMIQCILIVSPTSDQYLSGYEEPSSEDTSDSNNNNNNSTNDEEEKAKINNNNTTPCGTTSTATDTDGDDHQCTEPPSTTTTTTTAPTGSTPEATPNTSSKEKEQQKSSKQYDFTKIIIHHGHIHLVSPHLHNLQLNTLFTIQCMIPVEFRSRSPYPKIKTIHQITALRDGPVTTINTNTYLPKILIDSRNYISPMQYLLTTTMPFSTLLKSQPTLPNNILKPDPTQTRGLNIDEISQLQLKYDKQQQIIKLFYDNSYINNQLDGYTISTAVKEFVQYVNLVGSGSSNGSTGNDSKTGLTLEDCYLTKFPRYFTYSQDLIRNNGDGIDGSPNDTSNTSSSTTTTTTTTTTPTTGNSGIDNNSGNSSTNSTKHESGFITFSMPIGFSSTQSSIINNIVPLLPILNQQSGHMPQFTLTPLWYKKSYSIGLEEEGEEDSSSDLEEAFYSITKPSLSTATYINPIQPSNNKFRNKLHRFTSKCNASNMIASMSDQTLMLTPISGLRTPGSFTTNQNDDKKKKKNQDLGLNNIAVLPYSTQFCTKSPTSSSCRLHQDCQPTHYCDDWSQTCQYGTYRIEISVPFLSPPNESTLSWLSNWISMFFEDDGDGMTSATPDVLSNSAEGLLFTGFSSHFRTAFSGFGSVFSLQPAAAAAAETLHQHHYSQSFDHHYHHLLLPSQFLHQSDSSSFGGEILDGTAICHSPGINNGDSIFFPSQIKAYKALINIMLTTTMNFMTGICRFISSFGSQPAVALPVLTITIVSGHVLHQMIEILFILLEQLYYSLIHLVSIHFSTGYQGEFISMGLWYISTDLKSMTVNGLEMASLIFSNMKKLSSTSVFSLFFQETTSSVASVNGHEEEYYTSNCDLSHDDDCHLAHINTKNQQQQQQLNTLVQYQKKTKLAIIENLSRIEKKIGKKINPKDYNPTLPITKPLPSKAPFYSFSNYYTKQELTQIGTLLLFACCAMRHVIVKFPHFEQTLSVGIS